MAIEILSSNLNTYGDNGHFETDRSTWGFGDPLGKTITRSSSQKFAGLYAALSKTTTNFNEPTTGVTCKLPLPAGSVGKKYLIRAKIRTPSAAAFAADAETISIYAPGSVYYSVDASLTVTKTILQAKDTWVEVSVVIQYISEFFLGYFTFPLHVSGAHTVGGDFYTDEFEVYEVAVTADPPPTCTLAIDVAGTVVTNETSAAANDGSISVAITGGTAPIQYSKDNGVTWQTSNLFTGLDSGSYNVKAREQNNTSCVSSAVFTVNATAPSFDFTLNVTHETIAGASDGVIEVTVTGIGGPFQFSKNGGTTWQTSNIFSGLVPGTYYITVKNNDGTQQVTKSTVVNAGAVDIEKVWHSKNPVILEKLAASNWASLINYRLYNDVRVEDNAGSGVFTSKLKVDLHPDSTGKVIFYMAEAFRDAFSFITPDENETTIIKLTDRIKRFKNFSGSLQNQEITPAALTESLPSLVIWGGLSKEKFPGLNYFTTYLAANKKFLTWAPVQKYVDRNQEDYLNFFVYGFFTSLKLQIKAYFDDNTSQTAIISTITGVKRYELYQFPSGPTNSGAATINAAKNLVKYEISILDGGNVQISEVRTYHVMRYKNPLTRHFMFLNSLGSFEVLRFTGQAVESTSFNRDILQKFLPHNYDPQGGEFAVNEVTAQKRNSYSSGFIKGQLAAQWHEYMEDFLLSPRIFLVTDGQRLPVVITAGDLSREDQNHERYFRFEAKPAYDNTSYTPSDVE